MGDKSSIGEFALRHPVGVGLCIFAFGLLLGGIYSAGSGWSLPVVIATPIVAVAGGLVTSFLWRRPSGAFRRYYLRNTRPE